MDILQNGELYFFNPRLNHDISEIKEWISYSRGIPSPEYYLISNGKILNNGSVDCRRKIYIVPRILGGKGGFGSMLRAIGAQIEKTTNREACRDLSGRRLRDINEEQRLKNWIAHQADREREAKENKRKKLEKLCEAPKHEFKDEEYDKERSALPEKVEEAVLKGLEASCSGKRKIESQAPIEPKKKKKKLWLDDELDEDLSSSDSDPEHESSSTKKDNSDGLVIDSEGIDKRENDNTQQARKEDNKSA